MPCLFVQRRDYVFIFFCDSSRSGCDCNCSFENGYSSESDCSCRNGYNFGNDCSSGSGCSCHFGSACLNESDYVYG